ncbi:zinc finger protein 846-like isoform X1 [Ostrinia furnacalis]|uniref:zinc finger protein 846-like isoform X1 n=1 Tax=Ostrinia furnacalis TaxID=93504 RepID=UPI0010390298|nr:zinc finger protein 846-like isoform X1 [Ostrinia furnacalis]
MCDFVDFPDKLKAMSRQELISEQDNFKTVKESEICVCCLSKNVGFVSLTTCKHYSLFESLINFEFQYDNLVICRRCHHFLNKIDLFKEQVEECLEIVLKSQQLPLAAPSKRFQNFICSRTEQYTTFNDNIIVKIEPLIDHNQTLEVHQPLQYDLNTDVKIENDSSDLEVDVPLSEIRKDEEKRTKKKKRKKVPEVAVPKKSNTEIKNLGDKYDGKIAIVNLDREEVMLEREREARKESYLKLPFKCEDCITGFDHEINLNEHMEKRHGKKKGGYVCDICKSNLSTLPSYKEHLKRHSRRYECLDCGKRYNNVYSVVKHYNDTHGGVIETTYTCHECGFTTESHRGFRYHRDKHKQKVSCNICGSTFVAPAGLKVHMYTVHKQSSRVYSCEICNKVYNAKSGLVGHMTAVHSTSYSAYCTKCCKYFRTDQGLAHHLKTHSAHISDKDKRFKCSECDAKFLNKSTLQEHTDFVHLKNMKHECSDCQKVFKNASALKRHCDFVHKKIRPPRNHICDHCGRGFFTLAILQAHIRTHTGERPLQCPKCPATFAHSAALYTHNKLLHSGAKAQN